MKKYSKYSMISRLSERQGGQALIAILVFIGIAGILLTPLLNYIGTGLIVGKTYQNKAADYYAADAGIQDAQWQIGNDHLTTIFPSWDPLDFGTPTWGSTVDGTPGWYSLTNSGNPTKVNADNVSVRIINRWVVNGVTAPTSAAASNIITTQGSHIWVIGHDTGVVSPTTGTPVARQFQFSVFFNPVGNETFNVTSFGVWMPPGFTYDSSRGVAVNGVAYNGATLTQIPEAGGTSLVWTLTTPTDFMSMPNLNTGIHPLELKISFYQTQPNKIMTAVGWVRTTSNAVPYTWDAGLHVIQMTSKANTTYIDATVINQERQQVGGSLNGDYYATGNSLLKPSTDYKVRDQLYYSTTATVNSNADPTAGIPPSATLAAAYLYWSGWISAEGYNPMGASDVIITPPGTETGVSFADTPNLGPTWTAGSSWTINASRFQGRGNGTAANRVLTSASINLGAAYAGKTVLLYWDQSRSGTLTASDNLTCDISSNGGTTWTNLATVVGTSLSTTSTTIAPITIPVSYLSGAFQIRFVYNFTSTSKYVYLDNIKFVQPTIFLDTCDSLAKWTQSGTTWTSASSNFHAIGGGSSTNSYLTMASSVNLAAYSGITLAASLDTISDNFSGTDKLEVSFSKDGGGSWNTDGGPYLVMDASSNSGYTTFIIPNAYKTSTFKMQFKITASSSSHYTNIDNVTISGPTMKYPTNATSGSLGVLVEQVAKVNKVKFGTTSGASVTLNTTGLDSNGHPLGKYDVLPTAEVSGAGDSWAYSAEYDVTSIIQGWIASGQVSSNGAATYSLTHAFGVNTEDPNYKSSFTDTAGSTGYPLSTPGNEYSYAGWSIVLIYSSPATQGHQIWLYDIMNPNFNFTSAHGYDSTDPMDRIPDFDDDGQPGGYISGFLVPNSIQSETNASKITVFVGEGDAHYGYPATPSGGAGTTSSDADYFEVNGVRQSNAASPPGNVWNSASPGIAISGIDIDTFYLNYPLMQPGATTAQLNVGSNYEFITLNYIIISFRSDTVTGGAISYLIR